MNIIYTAAHVENKMVQNVAYNEMLLALGYNPIFVSAADRNTEDDPQARAAMIAKIADGLMLPGGQDVSPLKFGLPNTAAYSTCMKRDTFEIALIEEFMALDKPVFGICRGFQLICLYMKYIAGLKVMEEFQWHQHLKGHAQDQQHIARGESYHYVDIYSEDGKVSVELTNSLHHQGMVSSPHIRPDESDDILGTGFSDLNNQNKDFVLEHMEFANTKVSGVQWHPECMSFRHQQKYVGEFFDRMLNK